MGNPILNIHQQEKNIHQKWRRSLFTTIVRRMKKRPSISFSA